ncbi:bone marrow stromal antigen 2 [Hippopotamus amphibius kiboko]|uniref:bone marrow stromal antigen 2 n=1 Tax=Hippopotamus amphibius kiboko TaxID=575201 RepID=UPI00259A9B31|nr:bone marrow stromal antigen 2 [Hippopotamus amphibius kiboko]
MVAQLSVCLRGGCQPWLQFLLFLVVVVGLLVPLIFFAVRANSKGCRDGLQAQWECQNLTQHLQHQLTQTQEILNKSEVRAAACKQTVVSLRDSLKMEQTRVTELQEERRILEQKLRNALQEVEKLRRESEASAANDSFSSWNILFALILIVIAVCRVT